MYISMLKDQPFLVPTARRVQGSPRPPSPLSGEQRSQVPAKGAELSVSHFLCNFDPWEAGTTCYIVCLLVSVYSASPLMNSCSLPRTFLSFRAPVRVPPCQAGRKGRSEGWVERVVQGARGQRYRALIGGVKPLGVPSLYGGSQLGFLQETERGVPRKNFSLKFDLFGLKTEMTCPKVNTIQRKPRWEGGNHCWPQSFYL